MVVSPKQRLIETQIFGFLFNVEVDADDDDDESCWASFITSLLSTELKAKMKNKIVVAAMMRQRLQPVHRGNNNIVPSKSQKITKAVLTLFAQLPFEHVSCGEFDFTKQSLQLFLIALQKFCML